ncbi:hypothetical protein [Luteibacter yeojuensis]|uniref:Uncharacterized protein n=1 Tax=Luteibacter yeojuensis TaxID=345309 RepID=A0A7X5TN82_9GAMM|nr:hypothetical protein [Luteibacter yeojuensis]NID14386.1 hypothetical protein [Luteibacter yeojuensis]
MSEITIGRLCACMGPQGGDPYCPCRMQTEGLNGHYNCNGDKEAMARREAETQERLRIALRKFADKKTRTGDAK